MTWKVSIMNEEALEDASAELIDDMAEAFAELMEFYCLSKGTFNYENMVVTVEKMKNETSVSA